MLKSLNSKKQLNSHAAKAPPAFRPQPTPKCLQLKPIARPPSTVNASVTKHGPTPPPAYRPHPVPKVLQRKLAIVQPKSASQLRTFGVVQRAEAAPEAPRKQRVRKQIVWSEDVIVSMPA